MANSKISALTSATTPLAGTETLPIVQSSTTKQVSVANVTAGRDVAGKSFTASTGMLVRGSFGSTGRAAEFNGSDVLMDGAGQFDLIIGDGGVAYMSLTTTDNAVSMKVRDYSGGADLVTVTRSSGDTTINKGNLVQGTAAKGVNFTANTPASGMTSQLLNWYEEGTWTPIDSSGAGLTLTVLANSAKYVRTGRMVTATFALSYPVTAAAGQATIGGLPFTAGSGAGQGGYLVYTSLASIPGLNVGASTTKFYLYGGGGTGLSNVNMSAQDIRGVVTYFV